MILSASIEKAIGLLENIVDTCQCLIHFIVTFRQETTNTNQIPRTIETLKGITTAAEQAAYNVTKISNSTLYILSVVRCSMMKAH